MIESRHGNVRVSARASAAHSTTLVACTVFQLKLCDESKPRVLCSSVMNAGENDYREPTFLQIQHESMVRNIHHTTSIPSVVVGEAL
jgi:hypothetical protein